MKKSKILIIEDDADLRESLSDLLGATYDIEVAENGLIGLKQALRNPPDLILLDLKMPDMDGFQTCKLIRSDPEYDGIPVIIVSGYNSADDRTQAFENGADDFVAKPFSNSEMLSRIQRKIGVSKKGPAPAKAKDIISCGNIKLAPRNQEAWVEDRVIPLSAIEYGLLTLLVQSCGRVVTRENIFEKVWNSEPHSQRVIDPHIVSLRHKMTGADHAISVSYGKGYLLKKVSS